MTNKTPKPKMKNNQTLDLSVPFVLELPPGAIDSMKEECEEDIRKMEEQLQTLTETVAEMKNSPEDIDFQALVSQGIEIAKLQFQIHLRRGITK